MWPLKVAFFAALSLPLAAQVWVEISKFMRRDTTVTSTKKLKERVDFPAFSFCVKRGFKFDVMKNDLNIDEGFWIYSQYARSSYDKNASIFNDLDLARDVWKRSTFDLDDIIESIEFVDENQRRSFAKVRSAHRSIFRGV